MINKIIEAIKEAEINGLSVKTDSNVLSGFSGNKLVGSLQNILALYEEEPDTCYLEVGVFQGLTLLSVAAACPKLTCYGIDNFAYFDPKGENLSIVEQRSQRLGVDNKVLINEDYEDALESLKRHIAEKKIGLYFVDGPHDYRSQLMCLELALPYLHLNSTIVVDDCNYLHVRQANRDFLVTHPEFKLVFEAYTQCHPKNMSSADEAAARKGWWNGVNIMVRDAENLLQPMYPPTERSRLLYENEHIVHAARAAENAPQAVQILSSIYAGQFLRAAKSLLAITREYRRSSKKYRNRFDSMNTFSEHLSQSNYNEIL
jgi:hypothetical protein